VNGTRNENTGLPIGNEKTHHFLFTNDQVTVPKDTEFSKYQRN